jgi:hypothetical protein
MSVQEETSMKHIATIIVALNLACCVSAFAQEKDIRTITTSGEAVIFVVPDEAVITLGVRSRATELERAKAENDDIAARVVRAIKAAGIEDKHLATGNMNIELIHERDDDRRPTAYIVARMYMITLKDTKKLDEL